MAGIDTSVVIGNLRMKNPVMPASGAYDYYENNAGLFPMSDLGAIMLKSIHHDIRPGNKPPRIAETPSGMLNAIGLMGPGVDTFIEEDLPFLKQYDTKIIVNVCGHCEEDYLTVAEKLADTCADMLEINISCPNVKEGGIAFGTDPKKAEAVTAAVRKIARQPVIVKLSPNVTDIREIAKAVESGGADAVSLINTITGMKIDVRTRRFVLANRTGGLSGPAIHPVAVRMVYEAAHAVKIPVIGMGGITNAYDALEMILAGASAVAVGSATFRNPLAAAETAEGIEMYLRENEIASVRSLIGAVQE